MRLSDRMKEGGHRLFMEPICKVFRHTCSAGAIMFTGRRDRGFTLLEIMVALALVGGLLVTLLYSLNYHLGIAQRHEFLTVGTILARDKIIESENNPAESAGDFPEPFSGYRYKVEIRDSPYPGIAELSVTVSSGGEKTKLSELIKK